MTKPFDIVFASLGNGITVFDKNRQQYGDYKIIAHIDSHRRISWRVKTLPDQIRKKIIRYAQTENPNISQSQSEKVFEREV